MLIPLDYYRILGLPIQATAEQLQQAHRDRTLQLPRREYSEVAITARKQLLDEACSVLSATDKRQAYDASFLAKTYEQEQELGLAGVRHLWEKAALATKSPVSPASTDLTPDPWLVDSSSDPYTPSIDIEEKQFVGGLLILQELGEYELVLKLSLPYLANGATAVKEGRFGEPQLVLPDMVLTIALAYLELGREQWQQGQHDRAALSLETGQELLLRENLFPSLRGEMQADLYKLRPYRILELLALPEEKVAERRRGLQILKEMLNERGGIDGSGNDQSGLSIEDFLRFVQQLRKHLTTTEQQSLFEVEARRPSAVATYLAVYTLLAQGFANRQPALLRRAKLMLMQLGRRQDVYLEKAVCALLLGQTEEASRALDLSSESEPLAFIRQNSQDSPDLLPGLCLYAEHWLQEEVFPHFRDLAEQSVSLKDYFADENVQAYLEALPTDAEAANQWVVQPRSARTPTTLQKTKEQESVSPTPRTATATLTPPAGLSPTPATSPQKVETTPSRRGTEKPLLPTPGPESTTEPSRRPQTLRERKRGNRGGLALLERLPGGNRFNPQQLSATFKSLKGSKQQTPLILAAILLLLILGFIALQTFIWFASALNRLSGPTLSGEYPILGLEQPPVEIPEPQPTPTAATGVLTEETGGQVIQTWLTAKAAALGPDRATEKLQEILTDPALSRWQQMADAMQRNNAYQRYEHTLAVSSLATSEENPDRAQVEATVTEKAELYERDRLANTRDDNLRVRYDLVRQDGQWRIRDWEILK